MDCSFGTHSDRALKDQFITGLLSANIRKKSLASSESDLSTFEKVLAIAEREELAATQATELTTAGFLSVSQQESAGLVHSVRSSATRSRQPRGPPHKKPTTTSNSNKKLCFHCGSDLHLADKCTHKTTECRFCHKRGHLEQVCRAKHQRSQSDRCHHVDAMDQTVEYESEGESIPMYIVRDDNPGVPP